MLVALKSIVPSLLFLISTGVWFSRWGKKRKILVLLTGLVSSAATYDLAIAPIFGLKPIFTVESFNSIGDEIRSTIAAERDQRAAQEAERRAAELQARIKAAEDAERQAAVERERRLILEAENAERRAAEAMAKMKAAQEAERRATEATARIKAAQEEKRRIAEERARIASFHPAGYEFFKTRDEMGLPGACPHGYVQSGWKHDGRGGRSAYCRRIPGDPCAGTFGKSLVGFEPVGDGRVWSLCR